MTPVEPYNPTFSRRLIVAHLIANEARPSVPALMQLTGWPRRTLQDIIKALPSWGISLSFIQQGVRNNDGYYQIDSWGLFDASTVAAAFPALCATVELHINR